MKRRSALAGLFGTAVLMLAAAVVHVAAPSVPFLPSSIAQALVRTPPGSVESWFIGLLGHWAQRLALIGTALAFALSGAVLGLAIPPVVRRLRARQPVGGALVFLALWAASVAVYPSPAPPALSRWPFAAVSFPLYVAAGAMAGLALMRLSNREPAQSIATDRSRRYFLASMGLGGAGVLLGMSSVGSLFHRRPDPGDQLLRVFGLMPATPPPLDPAFQRIAGLSPALTPISDFYVVDESLIDPDIDPATWRLSIGGLVDRPFALSYPQLNRFPLIERFHTLECISNRVGGDLISTARWVGVPLRHILERAGVKPGAVEVVFRAAGGYSDSLPFDHAMDDTTLIAIGMNGHVLPRAHGYPARLLSVGTYGMKNPKWLTSIEVVNRPYVGFWEDRGWNPAAPIKTFSRIDTPRRPGSRGGRVVVAGVAFAGDRGVEQVEVSMDDGRTWNVAQLEPALSPYTWRRWKYVSPPDRASRAVVRAVDGRGVTQVQAPDDPFPDGASGYDSVVVRR